MNAVPDFFHELAHLLKVAYLAVWHAIVAVGHFFRHLFG